MSPARLYEDVERSLFRVKSVIAKPLPKPRENAAKICANSCVEHPKPSVKTRTIERVVLEGQSGDENRYIRVKIDGNDYDYFDAVVPHDDLVSELLPRLRHSVVESLKITNFRDRMMLDDDMMAKLCIIFRTVSVTKEVAITDSWFRGRKGEARPSLNHLMNCFGSFRPKSLDIWNSTGMRLDDRMLERFRESGIHCISLLHAEHAFTANGVQNFFFSGNNAGDGVRSLDIGSGCNPIKRLSPAFVHYFIKTNLLANTRGRLRLTAQVGDVRFNVRAYERQLVGEGGTTKIALNGLTVYLPTDANPTVRILS